MSKYKLIYFDFAARGEVSRLLFALAGVPFEDKRIDLKEWGVMKKGLKYTVIWRKREVRGLNADL